MRALHETGMRRGLHGVGIFGALLLFASCSTLQQLQQSGLEDPWQAVGAGDVSFGVGSGWAFYGATVEAEGTGGSLEGQTGRDQPDLTPRYGGALKVSRFFTDAFALGLVYEYRNFEVEPVEPLDAQLVAEPFETHHFLLTARHYWEPRGEGRRFLPFVGVDLGYVPSVDFGQVQVRYDGPRPDTIRIKGSDYWTLAPVLGASYMLQEGPEGLSLDAGVFYEFALTPGEDSLTLPQLGQATVDVEVWPEGLITFFGLTWYF